MKQFSPKAMPAIVGLGLSLGLSLSGLFTLPALGKQPPNDDPPPNTRGRSAGSRGCSFETASTGQESEAQGIGNQDLASQGGETMPALVILTPEGLGKTLSTQPTFVWYSRESNSETPLAFRLYEYDPAAQTYQLLVESFSAAMQGEAGIVALSLPSDVATLRVGQRYLWQVGIMCDRNRPSGDLFAEAEFEVVSPPPSLTQQISTATTTAEKVSLLIDAGLWYDALPLALSAEANTSDAMAAIQQALFAQVRATTTEQTQLENSPIRQVSMEETEMQE